VLPSRPLAFAKAGAYWVTVKPCCFA